MKTATFISYVAFFFFAFLAVARAMPEPVQAGSIVAREDDDYVPADDGLCDDDTDLKARGDKGHGYCWKKNGWDKCSKWGYCCRKNQTCCGGKKCCGKGYKCHRKEWHDDDDGHHKRGDDGHHRKYEWVCKKDHHW